MIPNLPARALRAVAPALLSALSLAMSPTFAEDGEAVARYRFDRSVCESGASWQDVPTCMKEAGAALQAARQGGLSDTLAGRDAYAINAMARCEPLPDAERADCIRRMHGEGSASGSVAGGGVLRELTTTVIVVPATE